MIHSAYGHSVAPYSASGREVRVYFDEVFDLSASLTLVLYVSNDAGYATQPTDTPASQPFQGRLEKFSFQRSILQSDIGQFTTGSGQLVINNADASFDQLSQVYAIDGRPITIRVGRKDQPYANSVLIAKVTAKGWNFEGNVITIDLVDYSYKLEVPLQSNVYGGTGGTDGGADLTGKRKPLAFGTPQNVSPVFLVPSLLIYQVHDGSLQSIDNVYDSAAALTPAGDVADYATLAAASVTSGQFMTCLALGLFKLGSTAIGQVTADVHGQNGAGFISTTADVVMWALTNRTSLISSDIAISTFTDLDTSQPAPIDYYHGPDDNLTVAAFIQLLMGGIGGWGGHRLDGSFEVRTFQAPAGSPSASFTRADMLDPDIQREPLPDAYNPPPYRWRVPYQRNWTVQTTGIAGGVTAARRAFLAEDVRLAEALSATIQTDHAFAQDRDPIAAYFKNQTDAQAEANRRIDLFKVTRAIYNMRVPRRALRRDMGDVIMVTHPRHDLSFGRLMTVVDVNIDIDFTQRNKIDSVVVRAYG